jgi:hypothetical protein
VAATIAFGIMFFRHNDLCNNEVSHPRIPLLFFLNDSRGYIGDEIGLDKDRGTLLIPGFYTGN